MNRSLSPRDRFRQHFLEATRRQAGLEVKAYSDCFRSPARLDNLFWVFAIRKQTCRVYLEAGRFFNHDYCRLLDFYNFFSEGARTLRIQKELEKRKKIRLNYWKPPDSGRLLRGRNSHAQIGYEDPCRGWEGSETEWLQLIGCLLYSWKELKTAFDPEFPELEKVLRRHELHTS